MSTRSILAALTLLAAASLAHAGDRSSAMESNFLQQLKAAIAHRDFARFAMMLDNDGNADAAQARELAAIEPYSLIFSNLERTYHFGPTGDCAPGTPGLTVLKVHGARLSRVVETSPVVAVLTVNFPSRPPKLIPVARPANAGPDWTPPPSGPVISTGIIPLVEKDGRLLIADVEWNSNGPVPAAKE